MTTGKRTLVAAGLLAALALSGCGGYQQNQGSGEPSGVPAPAGVDAENAAATDTEPVGIPTDKLIAVSIPRMGKVVTDAKGWILYRFDKDTANPPTTNCSGDCAKVWPPVLTDGTPTLTGITAGLVGTVARDDGASQVTLGGWPLYRYVGDLKPGQWKGQGVGGTWFVAAPDGKKNLSCLPSVPPAPATPPSTSPGTGGGEGGYGSGGGGGSGNGGSGGY